MSRRISLRLDDACITPVGRVLRPHHIDELAQLFKVLRREMNVAGPRPEQSEIFAPMKERFPERQSVLPGITGLAGVVGGFPVLRIDSLSNTIQRRQRPDSLLPRRVSAETGALTAWSFSTFAWPGLPPRAAH